MLIGGRQDQETGLVGGGCASLLVNVFSWSFGGSLCYLLCADAASLALPQAAIEKVRKLYRRWVPEEKIVDANLWSSELAKLSSNMLLAQRISSINAISQICEEAGADVEDISNILGMDPRIGSRYLRASVGFGGSCLKKDVLCMVYIAEHYQLFTVAEYFKMIVTINEANKERFSIRILETMYGTVRRKKICVLGYAFKADTADTRETPAVDIIRFLQQEGANVTVYDPKVPAEEVLHEFPNVHVASDPIAAMKKAHGVVVVTEWKEVWTSCVCCVSLRRSVWIADRLDAAVQGLQLEGGV